jgi:hypothetical protein
MLFLVLVMRLVVIGCEYAGKSTFLQKVLAWGRAHHIHFHVDDHFTIPDASLTDEDRDLYVTLPPMIKERYQRFQIWYHVRLLNTFDDMVAVGFHIEEVIYDPLYFHFTPRINPREVEASLPSDTILLLLRASPDAIRDRMERSPHKYNVIQIADIPTVLAKFETEYQHSLIPRKIAIDTTNLTPDEVLAGFISSVLSLPWRTLSEKDLLRIFASRDLT